MPSLDLEPADEAALAGEDGDGVRLAMRIITRLAEIHGAPRLIDVTSAHIDGCLYHGPASLDFATRLVEGGAKVAVPTTLNVGSLDLIHPHLYRGDPEEGRAARALMAAYEGLGCTPSWTCAPYQLPQRPALGEHVAWAESNAIAFANSVLGARTDRYGDFVDICAAITGRVPDAGLHRTENRRAEVLFRLEEISEGLLQEDVLYPVLGHIVGLRSGGRVPAIQGLPEGVDEDRLKALGAAAASSGSVALFHVIGTTPEAAELADPTGLPVEVLTSAEITEARDALTTAPGTKISAVSLGTPHFSVNEFSGLIDTLKGSGSVSKVEFYVSTGRAVLAEVERRGWDRILSDAGVQVVVDTCTYVTPIIRDHDVVMTNSAKWAYYAPGNLGIDVVFGSLEECVWSAAAGEVVRDPSLW
jgi:predicted aconitase